MTVVARGSLVPILMTLLLVAGLGSVATAQTADDALRAELEELKRGQERIEKQLGAIEALLEARPAPAAARPSAPDVAGEIFDLADNPVAGEPRARLTLVDFTDYQ